MQKFWKFFYNDTATTEIYTLSLHDALPIYAKSNPAKRPEHVNPLTRLARAEGQATKRDSSMRLSKARPIALRIDRKSTRLNSSHSQISYAVFCLKKKNPAKQIFQHKHVLLL